MATLSGPDAAIGMQFRDGRMLKVRELGGKLGALPVEALVGDDEPKPDVAVTKVPAAIERDKADLVVGVVSSNVLQATLRPVTGSGAIPVSANAGTSTLAGKGCSPLFHATAYRNGSSQALRDAPAARKAHLHV